MLLYLDMCCIKRPFDDQSHPRIRLESEAVLGLLAAESDSLRFVRSAALWLENEQNPLPTRAARVRRWLGTPQLIPEATAVVSRASDMIKLGLKSFDALHVASAEAVGANALATCDDRLIAAARRAGPLISVRILGVVELAAEVLS
jgi:predicted nucleic acid-binding protein